MKRDYRLIPGPGQAHSVSEILRRLAVAFRFVEIDWFAGAKYVDNLLCKLRDMKPPAEVLDRLVAKRTQVVSLAVADQSGVVSRFVVGMEDAIGLYFADPEEESTRALIGKLAAVLDYELVPVEPE